MSIKKLRERQQVDGPVTAASEHNATPKENRRQKGEPSFFHNSEKTQS